MPKLTATSKGLSATPEDLTATPNGNAGGPEEAVLVALAVVGEAGLSPAELRLRTALAERTQRRAVDRLVEAGLVGRQGERGRLYLTPAGTAEAGASTPQAPAGTPAAALDAALGLLPSEGLRAFVRLLLSVTVARHHLAHEQPSGWLSGVACGPTGTGKTLAGAIICRALGLDPSVHIRLTGSETERSLWGRREQVPGGGWAFRPAPPLGYPLLVLDELDKAPAELRTATLKLLQGETRVAVEDGVAEVVPAVLVTTNAPPASLRAEYQRRAVVLDTTPLRPMLSDVDMAAAHILTPGVLPVLDMERLRPPSTALPEGDMRAMRSLLKATLTDDGWALCDLRGLELAALGRAAVWGTDLSEAAIATVTDYLSTAWTVGEVMPERLADLRRALATGTAPAQALEAGEAERAALEAGRRQAREAKDVATLELVGARAALAERFGNAAVELVRRVPKADHHRAVAVGLARQLALLRTWSAEARSREHLGAAIRHGEVLLAEGAALLADLGRERELAEREKAQRKVLAEAQRASRERAGLARRRAQALASGRRPYDAGSGEQALDYLIRLGLVARAVEMSTVGPLVRWRSPHTGQTFGNADLGAWGSPGVRAVGLALLGREPALAPPAVPAAPTMPAVGPPRLALPAPSRPDFAGLVNLK